MDGGVDLRGAGLAGARRVDRSPARAKVTRSPCLAVVVLEGDGQLRLVEAGLGRACRRTPVARALGDRGDQRLDLRGVDVLGGRRDLAPLLFLLAVLVLDLGLLERDGLAVADDLEARGVEGPRVEQILLAVFGRSFFSSSRSADSMVKTTGRGEVAARRRSPSPAARRCTASPATSRSRSGRSRPACRGRTSSSPAARAPRSTSSAAP